MYYKLEKTYSLQHGTAVSGNAKFTSRRDNKPLMNITRFHFLIGLSNNYRPDSD